MFGLEDVNGRIIDIESSFAPGPTVFTVLWRAAVIGWIITTCVLHLWGRSRAEIGMWFGQYSNLSVLATVLYFVSALVAAIQIDGSIVKQRVTWWVKATWLWFSMAATLQLAAVLLFWVLVWKPGDEVTYFELASHGLFFLVLLIDGLAVNKIPVRLKGILPLLGYNVLYMVWSMVHSYCRLGNHSSTSNDPNSDDDALYAVLNWRVRLNVAVGTAVVCNVLLFPSLYLLVWVASASGDGCRFNGSSRCYIPIPQEEREMMIEEL